MLAVGGIIISLVIFWKVRRGRKAGRNRQQTFRCVHACVRVCLCVGVCGCVCGCVHSVCVCVCLISVGMFVQMVVFLILAISGHQLHNVSISLASCSPSGRLIYIQTNLDFMLLKVTINHQLSLSVV